MENKETILAEREDQPLDETLYVGKWEIRAFKVGEFDEINGDRNTCFKSKDLGLCCDDESASEAEAGASEVAAIFVSMRNRAAVRYAFVIGFKQSEVGHTREVGEETTSLHRINASYQSNDTEKR